MNAFVERHQDAIAGVISCFDRVILSGMLPDIGYAGAMGHYLRQRDIRYFDYARWAEPLRDTIRHHAESLAEAAGLEIEFVRKHKAFRKEERIKAVLAERGDHPGLVHIFSAMESCPSYRAWHDKTTHENTMRSTQGKCLHYYFYFIDEQFGLCYLRVPTWAPFRLQVYFNGHHWLAKRLDKAQVAYTMADNAFLTIEDFTKAQKLADRLEAKQLHRRLDRWTKQFFPLRKQFPAGYHWSFMQVEYATDVVFFRQAHFQPLYDAIVREAVHTVKADHVATFLGRKLTAAYQGELGNDFTTRIQGTRIRHHMGPASIKLYDKAGIMARVECTANDVSFFKHYRQVEQRDGDSVFKLAPLRKNIYSLADVRTLLSSANQRYLAFIASIDNPDAGQKRLAKVSSPIRNKGRSVRGFNLFHGEDLKLFQTILRGEWCISGFKASDLRQYFPDMTPGRCSYLLKRLRSHGLIKKIGRRYKYYLTKLGRRVVATALHMREKCILPDLCLEI